jgi:hypothetical protein
LRRLLIKLVAIETALVGWLSYWIFLVYANNPSVSAGLSEQLSRFPQLAFTTVDIAVMVIIAAFAITLAFKFHRGLRPGIRLERALQMLENLMKRNLILEAQVAELRVDKIHPATPPPSSAISVPGLAGPSFSAAMAPSPSEPRPGSWEKAFRTPLEAGPPAPKIPSPSISEAPFQRETGIPPPRIEVNPPTSTPTKPPIVISEKTGSFASGPISGDKFSDKPTGIPSSTSSSGWEDSPKYVGETTGVLTPSAIPKRVAPIASDSGGLRQPYIPVPAPRMPPPSVIVGPMNQKPSSPTRQTPRPIVRPTFPSKSSAKELASPTGSAESKPPSPPIVIDKSESIGDLKPSEPTKLTVSPSEEETKEKPADKSTGASKKKFPYEEDQ